jgi:large subunit ribosomal protein L25
MEITVKKREQKRKQTKTLLKKGVLPGVIYGPKRKSLDIQFDQKTFMKVFDKAGYSKVINVSVEGEKKVVKVLVREVQYHPVSDKPIHVSLFELDWEKPITAEIPVSLIGTSKAVQEKIGILLTPVDTIHVRCLPDDLPQEIQVDISTLEKIGDAISVGDLKLSKGVTLASEVASTTTVAYIAAPQKEEVVEEKAAEVTEEGEEAPTEEEGSTEETEEDKEKDTKKDTKEK